MSPEESSSVHAAALGAAIAGHADEIAARVRVPLADVAGGRHDAVAAELAEAVRLATVALGEWIGGGGPAASRAASRAVARLVGRLAARLAVSLTDTTTSCFAWRDAVLEVVQDEGRRRSLPPEALDDARTLVRRSCDATVVRLCEAFEDERRRVHDALSARQDELAFQATHDALTGLANRTHVLGRAERALVRARRSSAAVALLFVDLDNFKDVNDTLGHRAGDELLCSVAARLSAPLPRGALLGRLGGDEFVVLHEGVASNEEAVGLAERILAAMREPFTVTGLGERPLQVSASIGVALDDGGSAEELLRDADVAMYRAKWAGKNRYVLFEPEMQWAARSRLELDIELQLALENDEFFLVYQPTFDLADMRVTGVEALLRWRHPVRGVVVPGDFVPHLERSGLIDAVGRWVLHHACRQGAEWRALGHEIAISVNVSARQLDHAGFVDDVREALALSGFPARALTIEITETAIVRDTGRSALQLGAVRGLGVRIAVDDFGTGYSSLAHLQHFPVDALKIDRSFVSGMLRGREAGALVHTLVQLGKALGIETLAEGIEELPQLAHLRDEQCASGQGFLFAEPLRAEEIGAFFSNWGGGVAALGSV